jgi:flagella basal body P-ring formation protein FlgA
MLAAQGVEVGELRFGGAERVAITSADGDEVPTNNKPNRLRPATKNRHAAILAGETSDQPAAPLDETRASKLREQLDRIIANYLSAKTGKVGPWRIQCDAEQRELRRLDAAVSAPVCTGGNEPWIGRQRFTLSFSTSDGPIQIPILAEVSPPPMPAVVAVRAISRGDVIRAADVELRSVDNNSKLAGQRGAFDSVEKLIGMEARQAIREGEVVLTDQVKAPILVKRGETITVTSQSGGIRVRTTARATHDGAQGELVQVEALGSREKYDVKVVGPRQAAVFAVPRLATEPQQRTDTARR